MAKTKFATCMSKQLKGKLKGKPKTVRQAKFKAAVKTCRNQKPR